ncbi:fungal-specific transcription factor domain-containing protein [Xylaria curta]|nr:fungal-specific transcription factor domain-containing protein [Xylaria curta]
MTRPCDICRKRKLRCVKEPGSNRCVLCTFHHRDCTFVEKIPKRRTRQALSQPIAETITYAEGDAEHPNPIASTSTAAPTPKPAALENPVPTPSLLHHTLGLDRTTYSVFVGPSSLQEPSLVDLPENGPQPAQPNSHALPDLRRVAPLDVFIRRLHHSSSEAADLEAIESIVHPHGPALVGLYFRIVHPSYPILHKGVWLEKYQRDFREFRPCLLAAVYALAIDWWEYDVALSEKTKPRTDQLVEIATRTLATAMAHPILSGVQAGLLLLQRSGGDSWILSSQVVALAEELGLHADCLSWDIPDWEKGVRRRLAWAVYMQDKWGSLIHGRPSHINLMDWRLLPLRLSDFPESAADEDDTEGSTEVEKGRCLFMHLARLTMIMADVGAKLYTLDQTTNNEILATQGAVGLLELIKPIALQLKEWASAIPPGLGLEDVSDRKLCSNGYIHLSYYVAEIIIHRFVIRKLTPTTPAHVRQLCRDAARARFEHAISFIERLRPEHLQSFWWFASPKSLAMIDSFGTLLYATSTTSEDASFYRQTLESLHWTFKVRSKGSMIMAAAMHELREARLGLNLSLSPNLAPDYNWTMLRLMRY